MARALWKLSVNNSVALARGTLEDGPSELVPTTLDELLANESEGLQAAFDTAGVARVPPEARVLVPLEGQELWAAGVTFERSREARREESESPDIYTMVYDADRPELFLKACPGRVQGPGDPLSIRRDSAWNVPEPELAVLADSRGRLVAYSIGNDMSSRSIEGENPLYLPQAKVYRHSAAVGPCWVLACDAPEVASLEVRLQIRRRAELVFEGKAPLSAMRRHPPELLQWLFKAMDFPVGVALLTGTSVVPGPEVSLSEGDLVSVSITPFGTLENVIEAVGSAP